MAKGYDSAMTMGRRRLAILMVVALAASLSGCGRFHERPISASQSLALFEARSLSDEGLRQSLEAGLKYRLVPWPPQRWDLHLLTRVALHYHPDLEVARAQRDVAQAGEITAAQRPNPAVSFSPTYVTQITSAPFNPWILGISPDIPIETAGKRDKRIIHAQQLTESARLKIAVAAWSVRSRVRASLLNLFAARKTEILRIQLQGYQDELCHLLERRLKAGEISRPEANLGRLALEQTRLALRDAQRQSAEAQAQLADALGLPVSALDHVELSFMDFGRVAGIESVAEGEFRRQALLNRADVLAALSDYEASQSALRLEIAKQYPDLHMGPGVIFNQGEYKWVLGLNLTLPILNQNQGPIAEAEARRKESAARFESLQARVMGEIDRSLAAAKAAQLKLTVADELLAEQEKHQRSAENLFKAGETDRLALLTSRVDFVTTELARMDALIKAQQAVGLLEDALQKPMDEPQTTN